MIVLVLGEPDSGKSRYAEALVMAMCIGTGTEDMKDKPVHDLYYIATMNVVDEESEVRVRKHRQMREGKGFVTLEIPYRVDRALEHITSPAQSVVLLECVSNLVGNEMYDDPDRAYDRAGCPRDEWLKDTADAVVSDIRMLAERCKDLVIVANRFEPDAKGYDDMTRLYVELNNTVNERLAEIAGRVDGTEEIREAPGRL